jgi:hypothetical protein
MPRRKAKAKKVEVEYEINKYTIGLFSRSLSSDPQDIAIISLYMDETPRAYINFLPNSTLLPNPSHNKKKGIINFYFHVDHFDVISDMLRNEQPLFVQYNSPPPFATLRSGAEPIGEEEELFYPREDAPADE